MSALRKMIVIDEAPVAAEVAASKFKNIALFFAAPFIALAYVVALPFYGFGVVALLAVRAALKYEKLPALAAALRRIAIAVAAPFVGLAFAVLFPFIGLALLLGLAGKAATARA